MLRLISDPKLRTPCYVPFLVIVLVVPHNRLIIFPFLRLLWNTPEYLCELRYSEIWDDVIVRGRNT